MGGMKLTILHTGDAPAPLRERFPAYPEMIRHMFEAVGARFDYETIRVHDGEALPDPGGPEGVVITGSPAGVYDDLPWLAPLRAFIGEAYAARVPMLGICFGHQIMADALGGTVRKSEKGWGMGRHTYQVTQRPPFLGGDRTSYAIVCSHQDQVIEPPAEAEVFLASDFTPFAGLVYRNGAAVSVQPHPEFSDEYARELAELRRGRAPDATVDAALASFATPSDSRELARHLAAFLSG